MIESKDRELKKRIVAEMTDDYSGALEKNFEMAKGLLRITKEGKVNVLHKERLTGEDQITLYFIGKLYASEAGFIEKPEVDNKELMNELGIPKGSLLPWLKSLRDNKKAKQVKEGRTVFHTIPVNLIEKALRDIEKKIKSHAKEE